MRICFELIVLHPQMAHTAARVLQEGLLCPVAECLAMQRRELRQDRRPLQLGLQHSLQTHFNIAALLNVKYIQAIAVLHAMSSN